MSNHDLAVETVAISKLFCSPSNPRANDDAVPHVAASLRRFGWQQPVVARKSGEVIAGNTRLKAAISMDQSEVPVIWFEGSDIEAAAYSIADNRTSEFASWEDESLAKILAQLKEEDALDGVGFDDDDIDRLLSEIAEDDIDGLDDAGAEEPPDNPVTEHGGVVAWITLASPSLLIDLSVSIWRSSHGNQAFPSLPTVQDQIPRVQLFRV